MNRDTEVNLTWKNHLVVVSPYGASLRRYVVKTDAGEWNVIWGYSGGANKKGGQGDVLIPFPGRLANGAYEFEGQRYQIPKNDKDGPNAIHGFLRSELFETRRLSDSHVVFDYVIETEKFRERGFPFSLKVQVSYELGATGLKTSFEIKNQGQSAAPVGVGFHPYFRAESGALENWSVEIPARDYVEIENFLPTGRILAVDKTKFDFRHGRVIGDEAYNGCLTHLNRDAYGFAYATLHAGGSKNRVVIKMDKTFDYVVIYTGDAVPAPDNRKGFAIEPMTCAPDAFNRDGWGTKVLAAGETFSGSYWISPEFV